MFEDRTAENIKAEALAQAPKGVDIRKNSIYYDAISGVCEKIAQYYSDLRTAFDLVFITTAVGVYLDEKGQEYGVYRNQATHACYEYAFEGSRPAVGERFFTENNYFILIVKDDVLALEAEEVGKSGNNILFDTPAIPTRSIVGLFTSAFKEIIEPGVDIESDDDYRQRIREKIAGPAENGNRQHYKTWCESDSAVGRSRIIPLWMGENTVKGVLIGADGTPATQVVVDRVQEYVDPGSTGLGNGAANVGAHFTAAAAIALPIKFAFTAIISSNATLEQAASEAFNAITLHLKQLALDTPDTEKAVVRISMIGALIYSLPSIKDYMNLTFNGVSSNIEVEITDVAIVEEVIVNAPV